MLNGTFSIINTDPFEVEPTVECYKLQAIAIYCLIIFLLSLIANSVLLWILIYFKELRNSMNAFMLALTVCNLVGSLIEIPMVIISNFNCKWMFKRAGCVFAGFAMYSIGCTSVYLLTAISFERFYIIYKPLSIKTLNYKFSIIIIIICVLVGIVWALFPVFGWSHYSLEGSLTSCSVEWNERSVNVVSYNITIFTFVYVLPLCALIFSNIKLIIIIRNLPKFLSNSNGTLDRKMIKKIRVEKELTISALILIAGFMISWTPYAIVSMYTAFFDHGKMDPLTATIPSMFAKASLVWSSGIYIFTNKQVFKKFKKQFFSIEEQKSLTAIQSTVQNQLSTSKGESQSLST
ncbi:melanopsin [Brachionus plicatilis]|uniref:Melanopsin n=1 Tax=Brachionus plicatilis TaxID=10195 RepID=A0A3M7RXL2_BRAPC|nr:melanopsin [Brachionus plicatilis]